MNSICELPVGQSFYTRPFAGQTLQLHASGALFWAERELLVVSDLHFEKGSFFNGLGNPLPLLDTLDTLRRLRSLIEAFAPREVLCLGDSFHDAGALSRMPERDLACLNDLVKLVPRWTWVLGNHDPVIPESIAGHKATSWEADGLLFSHEPHAGVSAQVVGHFHPKTHHRIAGQRIQGRCFVVSRHLLLMPSFGTYTGGLNVNDSAIRNWMPGTVDTFLLFKSKIWRLGH